MNTEHTALITGGLGGLGTAIVRALHQAGHGVLLTHTPGNERVASQLEALRSAGCACTAYEVDVADYESCRRLGERVRADGHAVDILVNNAGIARDASFRKLDKPGWDLVLRTCLDSAFNVTKPFIDSMIERRWGRIINISSINGSKGQFGQTNYAAAKAGLHGFTKSLALEVARKGITVNTISPGYLNTRMVTAMPREVLESQVLPQIPVGRLGEPDEIAALVAFVASDAAAFMTGANLAMNGGQHMY